MKRKTSPWPRGKCVRFGAGRSRVRWVLPRPCKLVLRPSHQAHGVRKSCRELTPNIKTSRVKMKPDIVQTQPWCYKTIVVIKRRQQTTISNKQSNKMKGKLAITQWLCRRDLCELYQVHSNTKFRKKQCKNDGFCLEVNEWLKMPTVKAYQKLNLNNCERFSVPKIKLCFVCIAACNVTPH